MEAFNLMEAILWREQNVLPSGIPGFLLSSLRPIFLVITPPTETPSLSLCLLDEVPSSGRRSHSNMCRGQAGSEGVRQPDGFRALDGKALQIRTPFPSSHKRECSIQSDFLICQEKLEVGIFLWNYLTFKSWHPIHVLKHCKSQQPKPNIHGSALAEDHPSVCCS